MLEHRIRTSDNAPLELLGRDLEPDDHSRVPGGACPEAVVLGYEGGARLGELERTDEAPLVVRMHRLCRARIGMVACVR